MSNISKFSIFKCISSIILEKLSNVVTTLISYPDTISFLTVSCFTEIYGCLNVANQLFFVLLSQLRWPRVDPSMVSQKPCDGVRQNSDPQLHFDILWSLFRHWGLLDWYDIIFWRLKAFTRFIIPILKSLVAPVIWLALIGAIYSRINRIIFPANEEVTLKTKRPIRFQGL